MKPVILHLSNDYPDPLQPDKTRAVLSLVEGTPQYRHVVYSLNRVSAWNGIAAIPFGEDRTAVAYGALPKGIFWNARLADVSAWILADLKARRIVPNLIEAHKFTVEGLIGFRLAREFSCPLVCDIQGDSDTRILEKKTSLRGHYKDIARMAALVFPYAPWAIEPFRKNAGLDPAKCVCLPVIPNVDILTPAPIIAEDRLVSVFNLDSWKRKNIATVITAIQTLSSARPTLSLDIYGRGQPKNLLALQAVISRLDKARRVRLIGAAQNSALPSLLKNYAAFVMPSRRETYGLVYAEALFSGLPLLFSKNRGIDGYFDAQKIGYAADPFSATDIVRGIDHLLKNQSALKDQIANMQTSGELNPLRQRSILDVYSRAIDKVLG